MEKILSIIIPTYNMEKYLRNCLSSLLIGDNQDLLDVMIVNDGSKDSSLSIAMEFQEKYPKTFRVIDKENGNYGSCINRGLKEAKGKYIKVLDADDSYNTENFRLFVNKLTETDVDLFLSDYTIVDEQQNETGAHTRHNLIPEKIYNVDEFLLLCNTDIIMMHEIAYRTENLRKMQYRQTEGIAFTDAEWSLIPMTQVKTACYMQASVYRYLVGRQGQTVDICRAAKLQPQGDKTMFVQIEAFSNMTNLSPSVRDYMIAHITRNLRLTYRTYMITAYKSLSNDELRKYDARLKDANAELYALAEEMRVQPSIPFYFIKEWRNAGGNVTLSIKIFRKIVP